MKTIRELDSEVSNCLLDIRALEADVRETYYSDHMRERYQQIIARAWDLKVEAIRIQIQELEDEINNRDVLLLLMGRYFTHEADDRDFLLDSLRETVIVHIHLKKEGHEQNLIESDTRYYGKAAKFLSEVYQDMMRAKTFLSMHVHDFGNQDIA